MLKKLKNVKIEDFANNVERNIFNVKYYFDKIFITFAIIFISFFLLDSIIEISNNYIKLFFLVTLLFFLIFIAYYYSKIARIKSKKIISSCNSKSPENSNHLINNSDELNDSSNYTIESSENINFEFQFDDDLKSKIKRTVDILNISNDKTSLALLFIYIHKINPKYKNKYQNYFNIDILKNIETLIEFTHFTPNHYSIVMRSICYFNDNNGKIKIVKEINKTSTYYPKYINIQETFDSI